MDLEKRVTNLENLVNGLIINMNKNKFYTDADISGIRQNVGDIQKEVYPDWNPNKYPYFAGERVTYNNTYYRCIQNHTSQSDWAPDVAVSLWVATADPGEEWPEWKQPAGAHDAYNKGDKVSHNDKHWISDIDANVYEPSVYGWSEVE
jgi:hypothetical protein